MPTLFFPVMIMQLIQKEITIVVVGFGTHYGSK